MNNFYDIPRKTFIVMASLSALLGIVGIILIVTDSGTPNVIQQHSGRRVMNQTKEDENPIPIIVLWPDARVPFTFGSEIDEESTKEIEDAILFLKEKTCIKLEKKLDSDKYWLNFIQDNSICWDAQLGLDISREGSKRVQFGKNCLLKGIIQLILGRSLGLDFEETRPDRNKYIRYEDDCKNNLENQNISVNIPIGHHNEAALGIFFDYLSHMFRKQECLEPVLNGRIGFGSSSEDDGKPGILSVLDIEKLNAMYNCTGCKSYRFLPSEQVFNPASRSAFDQVKPVIGGKEIDGRTDLYICRVYQLGAILVGKVTTSFETTWKHGCWVEDRGREHSYESSFEVLTNLGGAHIKWKPRSAEGGEIPKYAVVGGRLQSKEPVYIGRCKIIFMGRETIAPGSIMQNSVFKVPFNHMASPCLHPHEILVCEE